MTQGETPSRRSPTAAAWPRVVGVACVAGVAGVVGVAAVCARRFERVTVAGTSMVPTLLPGDRLLVRRAAGRRVRPGAGCRVGDLVVVRGQTAGDVAVGRGAGVAPGRGAGVAPGRGAGVAPGRGAGVASGREPGAVVKRVVAVGAGGVTVAGDNPAASTDSRDYGPVPLADVTGRVVYRYAPAGRVGRLSGRRSAPLAG